MDSNKLMEIIKRNVVPALEDMDEDDIQEAIRENIDLESLVKEIYEESTEVRDKLKAKVKEMVLDDIDNISEVSDLEVYLDDNDWTDILKGTVDTDALRRMIKEDSKIQRELEKKTLDQMSDGLPDMDNLVNLVDEKVITERIKIIISDPDFQREYSTALNDRLKKIFMDYCRNSSKYDFIVNDNKIIHNILNTQVNDIIQNEQFLHDISGMFREYISRMVGNSEFHKMIFNQMLTRLTEMLVGRMFKQ